MKLPELIDTLEAVGARCWAKEGRLIIDAPVGALSEELKIELLRLKPALLRHLERPPEVVEAERREGLGKLLEALADRGVEIELARHGLRCRPDARVSRDEWSVLMESRPDLELLVKAAPGRKIEASELRLVGSLLRDYPTAQLAQNLEPIIEISRWCGSDIAQAELLLRLGPLRLVEAHPRMKA